MHASCLLDEGSLSWNEGQRAEDVGVSGVLFDFLRLCYKYDFKMSLNVTQGMVG